MKKGNMLMLACSTQLDGAVQLNGFVHVHIEKYGFPYVVENYNPIREEYYARKENSQTKWKDGQNVPSPASKG